MSEGQYTNRVELWSCGLGRQSVLMLGLIKLGQLPRPDHVCTVDTNRERTSSWEYNDKVFKPELAAMGIPFTVIDRAKYATVDLWGGEDGNSCLLPSYTTQGEDGDGKLPEFCSNEWKGRVAQRWAAEQLGWKERGVNCWIGISWEERKRRRNSETLWYQKTYPLLDVCRSHVSRVYDIHVQFGWPEPVRSCCWMCPNMANAEWKDEAVNWPTDFAKACDLDDEIRKTDPHAYVHHSRVPLRMADLDAPDTAERRGGCTSGFCY